MKREVIRVLLQAKRYRLANLVAAQPDETEKQTWTRRASRHHPDRGKLRGPDAKRKLMRRQREGLEEGPPEDFDET